jgi:copper chaperone CopZ
MRAVLEVKGMHCEGCENRIKAVFVGKEGIQEVIPDHKRGQVTVEHEGVDVKEIAKIIAGLGYEVKESEGVS